MDIKKTYIIAEAGVNHNGSYAIAKSYYLLQRNLELMQLNFKHLFLKML